MLKKPATFLKRFYACYNNGSHLILTTTNLQSKMVLTKFENDDQCFKALHFLKVFFLYALHLNTKL